MKIKFLKNTYIRLSPGEEQEPIGVIYRDAVLKVTGKVTGAELQWVSTWYRDRHGWYFWGGAVEEVPDNDPNASSTTGSEEAPEYPAEEPDPVYPPGDEQRPDDAGSDTYTEDPPPEPEEEPCEDPDKEDLPAYPTDEGENKYKPTDQSETYPEAPPEEPYEDPDREESTAYPTDESGNKYEPTDQGETYPEAPPRNPPEEPCEDPDREEPVAYPTDESGNEYETTDQGETYPEAPPRQPGQEDYPVDDSREEEEPCDPEDASSEPSAYPVQKGSPYPWHDRYRRQSSNVTEYDAERMNWGIEDLEIHHFFWNNCDLRGEGVRVAILDTGIDSDHPDLSGAVVGGCNFIGDDPNDYSDQDGHGTRMAGLLAGRGQEYVWGVAPETELFAVKIREGYGSPALEKLLAGIDWALDQRVDIILASVDFRKSDLTREEQKLLERKVRLVAKRGALLVAPAGNTTSNHPEGRYPASLEHCFSVGAYGRDGKRHEQSVRSSTLDALAPGVDLLTTTQGGGGAADFTGTDAAAAFAAGVAALLFNLLNDRSLPWSGLDVLTLIRETAVPRFRGNDLRDFEYGYGLINPAAAMEAVLKGIRPGEKIEQ